MLTLQKCERCECLKVVLFVYAANHQSLCGKCYAKMSMAHTSHA